MQHLQDVLEEAKQITDVLGTKGRGGAGGSGLENWREFTEMFLKGSKDHKKAWAQKMGWEDGGSRRYS